LKTSSDFSDFYSTALFFAIELEDVDPIVSNEIIQSQPVFPGSLASNVICLIDLLFDDDLNMNLQSISTLARRVLLGCIIDDPALFLRYFFEKITLKDKKVSERLKCGKEYGRLLSIEFRSRIT
jgi:hypothetical protein